MNYVIIEELRNAKLLWLEANQRKFEDEEEYKKI